MRLPAPPRKGVSLLEALIAVTILFIAVFTINQLADQTGKQARLVRERSLGMQLAQSKLNELTSGVLGQTLSSQSGTFDEAPNWEWSIDATQNDVSGLWNVTVQVKKQNSDAPAATLSQVVIDPSIRGSSSDVASVSGMDANSSSTDPAAGQSSSNTPAQTPASSSPASGAASKPSTSGAASKPSTGASSSGGTPSSGTPSGSSGKSSSGTSSSGAGSSGSGSTGGAGTGTSGTGGASSGSSGSSGSGTPASGTSGSGSKGGTGSGSTGTSGGMVK